MSIGVRPIATSAHPACTMAKLTRSRRPAADARAARSFSLTAAELAAPEGVLRAAAVAGCGGEGIVDKSSLGAESCLRSRACVAVPALLCTPALGSASAPRRSRRQPTRPRSSRVGSRAMATAAAKAITVRRLRSRWL
eukprot:scaffold11593_cov61-Phaeocystis_antarctica.AAC.3